MVPIRQISLVTIYCCDTIVWVECMGCKFQSEQLKSLVELQLTHPSFEVPVEELIGKQINALYIGSNENEEDAWLKFTTNQGEHIYYTNGDCCSRSWWSDVTGLQALLGNSVLCAEDKDLSARDVGSTDIGECVTFYGITLQTKDGHTDFVFRNESNGYYGGSCDYCGDTPRQQYNAEVTDPITWKQLTEDYPL